MSREMTLVREAGLLRDLADRKRAISQQMSCGVDSTQHDVVMDRHAHALPKERLAMGYAHTRRRRDLKQSQIAT